jgi:hypothetical protein
MASREKFYSSKAKIIIGRTAMVFTARFHLGRGYCCKTIAVIVRTRTRRQQRKLM